MIDSSFTTIVDSIYVMIKLCIVYMCCYRRETVTWQPAAALRSETMIASRHHVHQVNNNYKAHGGQFIVLFLPAHQPDTHVT